jgi:MerR family transcriptional regulator, aldehyde-responsive regulator
MSYTTKQVTEKLNLSMHTLRYYEKEGLLLPIERDKNGMRQYSDLDLERLALIRCMRATGMSISYIKDYMKLCTEGFSSIPKRKEMILLQKKFLEEQKKELDENLKMVNWKLEYYQELENNSPEEYDNIASKKRAVDFDTRMKTC